MRSLVLGGLTAFSFISAPTAVDLGARRAELARTHEQIAARAAIDFIDGISGSIAKDGFYNAALRSVGRGALAARTFLERDTMNLRSRATLSVVRLDVSADGNDGYTYGYLDVIRANGDTLPGAFKAYWRRGADGQWRALAFGRSSRQRGALTWLPDSLRPTATSYRSWPATDSTEAWASLRMTETAFSDSAQTDVRAAFMSFAAPDAGQIGGSGYVFGRESIGEGYRTPPPGFKGMSWGAQFGSVSASNDLGFNVGPVSVVGATGPGGLFFTIWRRQPNGEWRYLVD